MLRIELPSAGFVAVPYDAVAINGLYLGRTSKAEAEADVRSWAVLMPNGRAAMCGESNRPYPYESLEECRKDAEVIARYM